VSQINYPANTTMDDNKEYMVTLQIISLANDTDGKFNIPNVPG